MILCIAACDVVNNGELYSNLSLLDKCFPTCNNDERLSFSIVSDVVDKRMFTISKSSNKDKERIKSRNCLVCSVLFSYDERIMAKIECKTDRRRTKEKAMRVRAHRTTKKLRM